MQHTIREVKADGSIWYKTEHGLLHREDGPAVEFPNGKKFWYLWGDRGRKDGPAVECSNGDRSWYWAGQLHRVDGPAMIVGDKELYHLYDYPVTKEEFDRRVKEEFLTDTFPKTT